MFVAAHGVSLDAPATRPSPPSKSFMEWVQCLQYLCREIVCVGCCSFLSVVRWMDYLLCGAMGKKRASEQGGGGDDDLVAFSRVPLQGHTREASERASSAREEFAFHLSRHHLRAWAAFLRRCLKVAGAVSLSAVPPSLPGLPLCDSTPSQVLNDC